MKLLLQVRTCEDVPGDGDDVSTLFFGISSLNSCIIKYSIDWTFSSAPAL